MLICVEQLVLFLNFVNVELSDNSCCCTGPMTEQITTTLGTVTLQVVTNSSSSSETQTVACMAVFFHSC